MKAQLILENGTRFDGSLFGAVKDVAGEVVFTTGMGGYQEALTDPAVSGQIMVMTFPLIGNYGINLEDMESERAWPSAVVVREKCDYPSNFRNEMTLDDFLKEQGVVGIEGIDTRALTRHIRNNGNMKGVIAKGNISDDEAKKLIAGFDNSKAVLNATTKEAYTINPSGKKNIAFLDLGTKRSVLENLEKQGHKISVFPASTKADEILKANPDCLFVSDGPGAPCDISYVIETIKEVLGKMPVLGISLGHLAIGLALGAKADKMKFGHHGESQPVKDVEANTVYATAQGHEYVLCDLPEGTKATFVNINDGSIEGIANDELRVYSVQFHPEASQGPLDTTFLFDKFTSLI